VGEEGAGIAHQGRRSKNMEMVNIPLSTALGLVRFSVKNDRHFLTFLKSRRTTTSRFSSR
jgi:hypothetical protein